jgi:hypothetical protein
MYQHLPLREHPKFTQIGFFGLKRNHLATPLATPPGLFFYPKLMAAYWVTKLPSLRQNKWTYKRRKYSRRFASIFKHCIRKVAKVHPAVSPMLANDSIQRLPLLTDDIKGLVFCFIYILTICDDSSVKAFCLISKKHNAISFKQIPV